MVQSTVSLPWLLLLVVLHLQLLSTASYTDSDTASNPGGGTSTADDASARDVVSSSLSSMLGPDQSTQQHEQQPQQAQSDDHYHRQLQNWEAFNNVIYNAVIHLPDTQLSSSGLTLSVKNLQCTHLKVASMSVAPRTPITLQEIGVITTINGLDMDCTARYSFDGFLIVNGDGDLYVQSLQNSATMETVFKSYNYASYPPYDSSVVSCEPTVNINKIDFSNGGFWGWTLDQLENMFRGRFEEMAETRLCEELEKLFNQDMSALLTEWGTQLMEYPELLVIDPLASEQALMISQQQQALLVEHQLLNTTAARLISWQQPESYPFGFWMDDAWDDTVVFLNKPVVRADDGTMDMNANELIRQHVLDPTTGDLALDLDDETVDQILFEKHDEWLNTKAKLNKIKVVGLDTLTLLEPLETIGNYTLETKLAWESLKVELDVSIEISPSTLPNSQLSAGTGTTLAIEERITVQFALNEVTADIAILLALDQDLMEALKVGHFLDKDNILPCVMSSVYELEVSALEVEAADLEAPQISGFVSAGLDSVVSNAISSAFLMYEGAMLKSSKAFFHLAIRKIINIALEAQYESYGKAECQLYPMTLPYGLVDARDLLLLPNASMAVGGAGNERYGNLFADFVMPTLQKEVLSNDQINERFVRPMTLNQSGVVGMLKAPPAAAPWMDFEENGYNGTNWVGMLGWEKFGFKAFDAKLENADTISSPVQVLNPIESKSFSNMIGAGIDTPKRPLRFSTRMTLWARGIDDSVRDMANEMIIVVTVPSSMLAFKAEVAMEESSLLNFPLKDLDNDFCWLATLSKDPNQLSLDVNSIMTAFSSFTLTARCSSCSSPAGEAIPEILSTMERANFTSLFQPHLEVLLAECTQGLWDNMKMPLMIQDAPKLCPHHEDFDANAVVSDTYGLATAMSGSPQWSRQSLETISAIGFLCAYTSLLIMAKNYLLTDLLEPISVTAVSGGNGNQSLSELDLDGFRLLDWTNLSDSLGPWADTVLDEAREHLQATVSNVSVNTERRLNIFERTRTVADSVINGVKNRRLNQSRLLQANSWVRDFLLDQDGSLTIDLDNLSIDFAGISFSFLRARMMGADTITKLDPLIAVGPQTLENKIQLEQLDVTLDMTVQMGPELHNMTMDVSFSDVAIELPILLALDLDKMGQLKLESLLKMDNILPCLLPGAHKVYIPKLSVSVGKMERPVVGGFLSPSLISSVDSVNQGLFDAYGDELALALPGLFDSTVRRTLNTKLEQYIAQRDPTLCTVDAGGGEIDFRALFLKEEVSKSRGGSGVSPYGDLFQTLHEMLNKELSTDGNADSPSINSLLASMTSDQSGVPGTLHAKDNLLNTSLTMKLGGLDASMGILLKEISIENIDSFGAPLMMLDPIKSDVLNNTLSFGVGADPIKVAARLVISLTDDDEMQVRNEIEVRVDLYAATVIFSSLLRIAEDPILSMPLEDIPNLDCWLAKILATSNDRRGIAFEGQSFSMERLDLNVSCVSCTSPQFGELIADLYAPADAEDAKNTVVQTFNQVLDGSAIQDFSEQIVTDSASKCPHEALYDPTVSTSASELLTAKPFSFTDFSTRDSKSSYFNIANGIFAACLLVVFVIGKLIMRQKNRRWKESLSEEGLILLRQQKELEREQDVILNLYSTSLFRSPHVAQNVRWLVPIGLLLNLALYIVGHLGVISTVDLEVQLAGEEFTVHEFLEFSFLKSTGSTYQNGGMEMSITLWIFTGIWPYTKILVSLFLWFVPPKVLSVSTRGKVFLWIDTLTKLSIIDIFVMILMLAVLLVYIGGPDEAFSAAGALYSMKIIVIPGASVYCIIIAQRMSRVSSRFFLDTQERVVLATRGTSSESTASHLQKKGDDAEVSSKHKPALLEDDDQELPTTTLGEVNAEEEETAGSSDKRSLRSRLACLGYHLGLTFGGVTVLVFLIVGLIFAPSIAIEVSDVWGLALEADASYAEVAGGYGVFFVVSSVLLKSRFVMDTTWDYVALGLLLAAGFIAVGMTFFISCFHFFKKVSKKGWAAIRPDQQSEIYQLPAYLSRHAYKNIEIYGIAVIVGCWQLGSVSIYAIHLYCSILDAVYRLLTYVGLAEESSVQCYQAQMALPDNLLIFFGAFFILMVNFCIQCTMQYRKNLREACDMLRQEDHQIDHLSSLWNTTKQSTRSFWGGSRSQALKNAQTVAFSEEGSGESSEDEDGAGGGGYLARSSSPFVFGQQPQPQPHPSLDDTISLSTFGGSPSRSHDLGSPTLSTRSGSSLLVPESPGSFSTADDAAPPTTTMSAPDAMADDSLASESEEFGPQGLFHSATVGTSFESAATEVLSFDNAVEGSSFDSNEEEEYHT